MGFLDKIRSFVESGELDKITEKVGQTVNTLLDEQKSAAQYARSAAQTVTQAAPQASAAVSPAKPSRNVTFTFCDSDDNNADIDIESSFMLSGDFVESRSGAAEIDYCAVYAPESNADYEEGDSSQPVFIIANVAESEIHSIICNYKKGIADSSITKVNLPYDRIYFKAKLSHRGIITYFYALDRGHMWENSYIGVNYSPSLAGTALEAKLMAAVDEAAATYKETIL